MADLLRINRGFLAPGTRYATTVTSPPSQRRVISDLLHAHERGEALPHVISDESGRGHRIGIPAFATSDGERWTKGVAVDPDLVAR
jgi:hypothetical protein